MTKTFLSLDFIVVQKTLKVNYAITSVNIGRVSLRDINKWLFFFLFIWNFMNMREQGRLQNKLNRRTIGFH